MWFLLLVDLMFFRHPEMFQHINVGLSSWFIFSVNTGADSLSTSAVLGQRCSEMMVLSSRDEGGALICPSVSPVGFSLMFSLFYELLAGGSAVPPSLMFGRCNCRRSIRSSNSWSIPSTGKAFGIEQSLLLLPSVPRRQIDQVSMEQPGEARM